MENTKQETVKNQEIDTAGIYDFSNPFFRNYISLKHILTHLHEVNEILQLLDEELMKYRNCVQKKLSPTTEMQDDPKMVLWWKKEIQKEMKIFYYNTSYCLKILCSNFCKKITMNVIWSFLIKLFL